MRWLQARLYNVLENPDAPLLGRILNGFLILLIILNVVAAILFTVHSLALEHARNFYIFELVSVIIFTIEYIVRMWICTLNPAYRHPILGRIRYFFTMAGLVDLVAILPFYLPMFIHADLLFLRALRLLRLLRLLKLGRYSESIRMIGTVVTARKAELLVSVMMSVILLLISSGLMYYIENGVQPTVFSSVPAAMWWGVVTMTTVGYGDVYPVTPLGKVLAAIIAILGISLFILPAGIIAAGYTESFTGNGRNETYARIAVVCYHSSGGTLRKTRDQVARMERRFARNIAALDGLFEYIDAFAAAQGIGERALFTVKLAAEELFMNLLRHNTGGGEAIGVSLESDGARLVMKLTDFDVDPVVIDPDRPVDVSGALGDRTPGGLGIHLVKSMVDSLEYEYADRVFRVTAIKKLENPHV